jgi:hypothetical protein
MRRRRREINDLKGRVAEALVEGVFRRAGYFVSRCGRESQVERLLKVGGDEFLPDFLIRKAVSRPGSERPLHRLVPVEVKYRHDVPTFLRLHGAEFLGQAASQWPDLYLVFVTDQPDKGRSCLQVLDVRKGEAVTVDLHVVTDLDIYESTVREYEALVQGIFPLIDGSVRDVDGRRVTDISSGLLTWA